MDDAVLVGVVNGLGQRRHKLSRGAGRPRRTAKMLGQAAAGQKLHREERVALAFADFVNLDDVQMLQTRGGAGLSMKACQLFFPCERSRQHHLERHDPVEPKLVGPVDNPHPAPADLLQDLVAGGSQGLGGRYFRHRPCCFRCDGFGLGGVRRGPPGPG